MGLLRLLFGLPLLALALTAGLLLMAVEGQPLLDGPPRPPSAQDLARAKGLLARHDPRRLPPGRQGSLILGPAEVDLALAALAHYQPGLRAGLDLAAAPPRLALSLPLTPSGPWFNLALELHPSPQGIALHKLQLGGLPIPDAWADWGLDFARRRLAASPDWGPLLQGVERLSLEPAGIRLAYRAPRGLPGRLGALLLPPDEVARIKHYQERLVEQLTAAPSTIALPRLLAPLFGEVLARGNRPEEARAALAVLGAHLAGRSFSTLVPEAKSWPTPPRRTITLAGRVDSAQHWAVSALLAAGAGSPLANAVGLWKELADSRGGSGFSFADLAADLAGTRVGETLAGPHGPHLARQLAAGMAENALIPPLQGLPENLQQARFLARYGGPGDPRYEALEQDIARRVAALPLGP